MHKNRAYEDFRRSYAILGPGINENSKVPFSLQGGTAAQIVDTAIGDPETFYEPFTGISYYRGKKTYAMLTVPGRYYIVIFDKRHERGDYVIAVGEKESFSPGDLPGLIADVLRIRTGGIDHSSTLSGGR